MKKINIISLFFLMFLGISVSNAQTQVPNGGFENWTDTATCDGWQGTISVMGFLTANLMVQTDQAKSGQFAAKVQTQELMLLGTIPGIATTGALALDVLGGGGLSITGGVPLTGKPTKLNGFFKYDNMQGDTMVIFIVTTKWNAGTQTRDTLTQAAFATNQQVSTYEAFSIDLDYTPSTATPDSFNIIMISSAGSAPQLGTMLFVDDLSFEYNNVGIGETENSIFSVYPNPSTGNVHISIDSNEPSQVSVYNSLGQLVNHTENVQRWHIMDLSGNSNGIYFIEVRNGNETYTKKLMLNR